MSPNPSEAEAVNLSAPVTEHEIPPPLLEKLKRRVARSIIRARGPTGRPPPCHRCEATFTSYAARRAHLREHFAQEFGS